MDLGWVHPELGQIYMDSSWIYEYLGLISEDIG